MRLDPQIVRWALKKMLLLERNPEAGEGLRGHMEINRKLGQPDYPATAVMDAWLKKVLG